MALTQQQAQFINNLALHIKAQEAILVEAMKLDAQWSIAFQSAGTQPITDQAIGESNERYSNVGLTQQDVEEMMYCVSVNMANIRDRIARAARVSSLA